MSDLLGYFFLVLIAMGLSLYLIFWMLINNKVRKIDKEE